MFTLANVLSLLRLPLALAFLQESPQIRVAAIVCAMITDALDGYLARRRQAITKVGVILDPLTDKFFVIFALSVLFTEQGLAPWKGAAMLCRDIAIVVFGFYLLFKGRLFNYRPRAIFFGKITTTFQLIVLILLTIQVQIPTVVFIGFVVLGGCALLELYFSRYQTIST